MIELIQNFINLFDYCEAKKNPDKILILIKDATLKTLIAHHQQAENLVTVRFCSFSERTSVAPPAGRKWCCVSSFF
jgi:hypothetical protein